MIKRIVPMTHDYDSVISYKYNKIVTLNEYNSGYDYLLNSEDDVIKQSNVMLKEFFNKEYDIYEQ